MFSANKGIAPKALTKIASGGEVSRLMLAMKIAVTDSEIQTLVFDEIDTGISGITAQKMAEKLKELSASYQVLLVTHLPQIAAMAQAHAGGAVKSSDDMVTSTQILQLNREEKEKEIAKMIGGERLSASALAHARQMLDAAKTRHGSRDMTIRLAQTDDLPFLEEMYRQVVVAMCRNGLFNRKITENKANYIYYKSSYYREEIVMGYWKCQNIPQNDSTLKNIIFQYVVSCPSSIRKKEGGGYVYSSVSQKKNCSFRKRGITHSLLTTLLSQIKKSLVTNEAYQA